MDVMRLVVVLVGCLVLCVGCGRSGLKEKAKRVTNKAGQTVGEGASSFFTGVSEGIDKTVTSYDVRLSEVLVASGVSVTIAKRTEGAGADHSRSALSFYIINKDTLSGTLRLRLFNDHDQEIGRSTAQVAFEADDARYVPFPLDKEIPLSLTQYVELDLKQE